MCSLPPTDLASIDSLIFRCLQEFQMTWETPSVGLENSSATFTCIYYLENNDLIDDDVTHVNWWCHMYKHRYWWCHSNHNLTNRDRNKCCWYNHNVYLKWWQTSDTASVRAFLTLQPSTGMTCSMSCTNSNAWPSNSIVTSTTFNYKS